MKTLEGKCLHQRLVPVSHPVSAEAAVEQCLKERIVFFPPWCRGKGLKPVLWFGAKVFQHGGKEG